jgi:Fungal specific transcription factor domain
MKQSSSYLGISSVMAALRVILWIDPECQAFVNKSPSRSQMASRAASVPPDLVGAVSAPTASVEMQANSPWDEIPAVNAYFQYVHPFIPLIDETSFRDTYMTKQRSDSRWILLLNTVLAMGCMANGNSEDTIHSIYFDRAKEHLNVDTLGSAHIETVQALAILSGFYLHYVQQPNVANSLMGAALRMATALGLHRDYTEGVGPANTRKANFSIEMRRRVWWSTFLLDSWASNALGRPSMGRFSHAITARSPQEPIVSHWPLAVPL